MILKHCNNDALSEVCPKKERKRRNKLLITELFMDFAKNTTLHGLRYITEQGLSVIEKVFWTSTFVLSVILCSYLIGKVWIKWKTSPIIVSYDEKIIPTGTVPFPSVTICPQIKTLSTIYNFTKEFEENCASEILEKEFYHAYPYYNCSRGKSNNTLIDLEKLRMIALLCDVTGISSSHNNTNVSSIAHMFEVAPKISDVFQLCLWRGESVDCDEIFKTALTGEGVCYNFNGLSAKEMFREGKVQSEYSYLHTTKKTRGWDLIRGYWYNEGNPYPRRGRENGAGPDLEVILKNDDERNADLLCNSGGYKIYVQHPVDMPTHSLYHYSVMPNEVTSIALKLSMLTTSPNLRGYSPDVRQCNFPEDQRLDFFKIYTENNCRLECALHYTKENCKCVPFNLPFSGEDIDHICSMNIWHRMCEKESNYMSVHVLTDRCKCLPECDRVYYEADVLKSHFDYSSYTESFVTMNNESLQFQDNIKEALEYLEQLNAFDKTIRYSKLEFFFKEPQFLSIRRSELFSITDFFSNCGCLLSLFLGFSLLSLFEIIYFLTLRLLCKILKHRKQADKERGLKRRQLFLNRNLY